MGRRDKASRSSSSKRHRPRRRHRRTRSRDSYTSASSCSCSDCGSGSDSGSGSDTSASSHKRRKRKSKNKNKVKGKSRRRERDRDPPSRAAVQVEQQAASMGKHPKIAMILLLGREEREFRLTEAQILFDSPNDLTSTYYAQDPSDPDSALPKTYRMPDRDPGVFEIIYRYMNRESVLPLRKSACPKYLSYEQTERKLAEEAKFYRLTKLLKQLPRPGEGRGETVDMEQPAVLARDYAQSQPQPQPQQMQVQQPQPHMQMQMPPLQQQQQWGNAPASVNSGIGGVQPGAYAQPLPSLGQPPSVSYQQSLQPSYQPQASLQPGFPAVGSHQQLYSPAPQLPPTPMLPPSALPQPGPSPSIASSSRSRQTSSPHRLHSRQSSSSRLTIKPERKSSEEAPSVTAFLYRGEAAPRRGEAPFPLKGYPDDSPLPHLLVKATNAEIKFSAFRNAENEELFELRYSIRILDEPATRPLAYRVKDETIKAVDSHLRLNGVLGNLDARDVPIRIQHSTASSSSTSSGTSTGASEHLSDLEELLSLLSTQGYVKWPRVWQDSCDNLTAVSSAHQRVSLPCAELLFALEFPEEAAQISAEVGGRGFVLDTEDEEEMSVRNYRVSLHALRAETRKMRRIREMDELGQAVHEGMSLRTPSRDAGSRKASSDLGIPHSPARARSDSGYGTDRRASYDTASDVGSSVSRRPPRSDSGSATAASLGLPQHGHAHRAKPSAASSTSSASLAVPQYHYVQRPGHSSGRSHASASTPRTARSQAPSEYANYPRSPSTSSQAYQSQPVAEARPPRGYYHPLAQNVPDTPQTWSKPQDPSYHQPMQATLPTRPPPSPYYASDPGKGGSAQRRSEAMLAPPRQDAYGYTSGGRPRSSSSQSGMSVRTTASEEIKRRAMERWGD